MSHVAQCNVVVKNIKDLEAAALRLNGVLTIGGTMQWYGSGFVDDSSDWKSFFDDETAKVIASMSRDARIKIINDMMQNPDYTIKFPGISYNVGVFKQNDGSYRLRYDYYNSQLKAKLGGSKAGLLAQAYAIEAAKRAAKLKGWVTKEIKRKDGGIRVQVRVP